MLSGYGGLFFSLYYGNGAAAAVVVDYRGLTVEQDTQLRKQLREAGVTYKVYKNTLINIAVKDTPFEELSKNLEGPTAIAISKTDATAPARIICKFAKEAKAPIILYSVASRTGVNIAPETVAALHKNIENIVAVKEASGNISQISKIMQLTDGKIDLYSGNDDQIVPLLSLGAKGVISVLANVAPDETHDICAKFFAGDMQGSLALQLRALPLISQLFCEVNPIPVKTAMNMMGMEVGPLRMPLTELTPQHEESLAKAMTEFGIKLA